MGVKKIIRVDKKPVKKKIIKKVAKKKSAPPKKVATYEQLVSQIEYLTDLLEDSGYDEDVADARELIGQKNTIQDDILLKVIVFNGAEIPYGLDVYDLSNYEVTVTLGDKVVESVLEDVY